MKKERQEGTQGQWRQESPTKEILEQVRKNADTDCTSKLMRYGYYALKGGEWEELKRKFRVDTTATEWAFDRMR